MLLHSILLLVLPRTLLGGFFFNPFRDFIQCRLCQSVRLEGLISDCSCDFRSVDKSVNRFFSPLLENITSRTFFRYFRVNLEQPCPFWQEDGKCMMESCSVCTCEENEVPESWMKEGRPLDPDLGYEKNSNSFGWITSPSSAFGYTGAGYNNILGRLNMPATAENARDQQENGSSYLKYLKDIEDDDRDWTDMPEDSMTSKVKPSPWSLHGPPSLDLYRTEKVQQPQQTSKAPQGVYVNLLQNPEQFTGYAGPSAARVWQSIQHENCFGGVDDICVEKRVFHRLMSGLQASISTHIAKEYYYPDGKWGTNLPLFVKAVGSHPDRMSNLYFTFLFVLRAVVKAGDTLTDYPYHTGKKEDDEMVRTLIRRLVKARQPSLYPKGFTSIAREKTAKALKAILELSEEGKKNGKDAGSRNKTEGKFSDELEQCRTGFDESVLFQVPTRWSDTDSLSTRDILVKQQLREEFRNRFRNITRIMDCVTCEKCKVWGKLQILGLGTAIKILLTPEEELRESTGFLNRQEVIALVNTLNQFTKSVSFAAHASELEFTAKLNDFRMKGLFSFCIISVVTLFFYVRHKLRRA